MLPRSETVAAYRANREELAKNRERLKTLRNYQENIAQAWEEADPGVLGNGLDHIYGEGKMSGAPRCIEPMTSSNPAEARVGIW